MDYNKKLRDYFILPEGFVEDLFHEIALKYGLINYNHTLYTAPMIRSEPIENLDPNRNFFAIWYYGKGNVAINYFMYTYKFGNNLKENVILDSNLTIKQLMEFIEAMIKHIKLEKMKTKLNRIEEDF